jgi:tetratricopeptide (TPR) repeat protein
MRTGLARLREQGSVLWTPLFETMLAEIEAEAGQIDAALATIDHVTSESARTAQRWFSAETHRIRGEILLKQNPADPAPAEAAFLAAIAVAQQQKARSFELRAALSLAELYESTGRPIDAHDVLGPALAGFSPTPEFSQIAEAKALFDALAGDERMKAEAARRAQRLKLQTSYGQAMGYLKGFAAEETKAVLAQTLGLAAQSSNVAERLKAHYARWIALYTGGELESAHEAAEGFLREAKLAGDAPAVAYAGRVLGQTCLFQGRFAEAREHLREALRVYSPGWDASVRRQLGSDAGIGAKAFLAMVAWHVGDATGASAQFEAALTEALASEHVPTIANNFLFNLTKSHSTQMFSIRYRVSSGGTSIGPRSKCNCAI